MQHFLINKSLVLSLLFGGGLLMTGCSEDSNVEPIPPSKVYITVKSAADSSVIAGANVVLYNANSGASISRTFSGNDGVAAFENLSSGNFYVRIASQGFKEIPQGSINPVPFSVGQGQTFSQTYYMDVLPGNFGKIDGTINPALSSFLIVASSNTSSTEFHTYSGPDGYFVLFNMPYDIYVVDAIRSGYQSANQPIATVSPTSSSVTIQINVNQITGSTLSGMVTFLAAQNGIVDISLLDKNSMSVVNGLTTMIDVNRNFSIRNIPAGDYVAWASYRNDNYVMDPDWIYKNPGTLNISFSKDSSATLNFSVTDVINLISPTNPPNNIVPVLADSVVPTFQWVAYPQTKEYIIEVRDINGNLVWGGFTESGVIRHTQIPKEWTSVQFNFDGSALVGLNPGNIYQWRIYSDDDDMINVQTLLSSSEDLMGLFIVP